LAYRTAAPYDIFVKERRSEASHLLISFAYSLCIMAAFNVVSKLIVAVVETVTELNATELKSCLIN